MELDPYVSNNHHYEVRSIYFDSPFKKAFFDKTNGIKTRVKLRIRYYPDFQNGEKELVFIELKKKNNENVSKSRILVPFKDAFKIPAPRIITAEEKVVQVQPSVELEKEKIRAEVEKERLKLEKKKAKAEAKKAKKTKK